MSEGISSTTIRDSTVDDLESIHSVLIDAFTKTPFGYNGEADLVDALWSSPESLSLVACRNSNIIGQILFTPVTIQSSQGDLSGMGLAPLSVATEFQGQGVGSLLITNGLERLTEENCPFAVVLGNPDYYRRFGFLPAKQFGVSHGFNGISQDVFLMHNLQNAANPTIANGLAYFQSEFGPQHR